MNDNDLWESHRFMKSLISQTTTVFKKCNVSPFPHLKSHGTKFDLDGKIGQGQPRVTIWTSLVELGHLMLHIKFQGNQPRGSGEEDFLMFLPYMGMAAILVIRPVPFEQIFNQPLPGGCIWNSIRSGPAVSEEKSFENVNRHSILVTFGQDHWMTLAFGIQRGAWRNFFHITDYHCFGKMQCFTFSPFKSPLDGVRPWWKMGQGQPMVIIWT